MAATSPCSATMLFRRALAFSSVVAVLWVTGCGTPAIKASRTMAVTMEAETKTRTIDLKPMTQLDLTLPAVEAGFVWQISFHDARYLQQVQPLTAGATGVGSTISFITVRVGRTRVRFLLLPMSAGREASPIDQQEIVMTIQY